MAQESGNIIPALRELPHAAYREGRIAHPGDAKRATGMPGARRSSPAHPLLSQSF